MADTNGGSNNGVGNNDYVNGSVGGGHLNGNRNGHINGNGATNGARRGGGRAGTSHSKIHSITTPIYALANQWQGLGIHMPDPMPLIVTMGAFAANCMTGDPVWLWLVGPSGSGKTMVLKSLRSLPRTRMVSSISGEAALLSGVKKKDRAKDATGGLLTELGEDGGCLLFMDLTTELSKRREDVTQFFGALREIYDKTYSRSIGGEGGRTLSYTGRVAILGGVTSAIDRMAGISQEMGQRTLFYRMPLSDGYQEGLAAIRNITPDDTDEMMQASVFMLFHLLELRLEKGLLRQRERLPLATEDWITRLGITAARMRAGVARDFTQREIVQAAEPEYATRIARQMAQLYCGMKAIGADEQDRRAVLEKVALDSMPGLRLAVMRELLEGNGDSKKIAERVGVSEVTAVRTLEDLAAVKVAAPAKGKAQSGMAGVRGTAMLSKAGHAAWGLTEWADAYLTQVAAGRLAVKEAE